MEVCYEEIEFHYRFIRYDDAGDRMWWTKRESSG